MKCDCCGGWGDLGYIEGKEGWRICPLCEGKGFYGDDEQ